MYDDRATPPLGSALRTALNTRRGSDHATSGRAGMGLMARENSRRSDDRIRIARTVAIRKRAGRLSGRARANALSRTDIPLNRFKHWVQV